ncbi:6-hydroxymethylpterin diphosphokinase MptE-like protein [Neobacillus sp. PS3-40]|uniref:motility associated factor glycosyltransferase family protein n=1 Tax=Neobacillus sp. PS3-40 TaxID=3070679 RepID=UPI0027E0244B|nr:6-hydroxymethylpterin diphosphokinase MptE-like protein [Neobacillus sp. PS3-40]WML46084.1 DUF115 domain-containing protein [Neobacillus sp. PS3-40]
MNNIFIVEGKQKSSNEDISVIESKSGLAFVKYNGFYLNSQHDPVKEAKRLANHYYKKNHAHILFGLGFSYLAKELLEKMGESDFLFIIEPSIRLFEEVRDKCDLGSLVDHKRVFFIVGYEKEQIEDEVKFLVTSDYMAQIEFIVSPNYEKLYSQYVKVIGDIITTTVKLSVVNIGTIAVFSKIWQKNMLYNLNESWKSIPFKVFENKFTCPIIIAASGPSLTKQLEHLRKVRENNSALIIAAGSTINPLLKAGIKPHLVVSIDGGEANWAHFKNTNYDDIPLFYSLSVHKDIPKHHQGFKVVYNTGDETLSAWINKAVGKDLGFVVGGASVANFCFYIAKIITSGPISFIGQDLAYTNNLTHAEGNTNFKGVTKEELVKQNRYVSVKGYYGGEVLSDFPFLSMKRVFEDMITAFRKYGDNRPIYNSTEGGAFLEGITNLEFEKFINTYCNKNYNEEFNEAFKSYDPDYENRSQIIDSLETERENLQKVVRVAKKAIDILSSTSRETVTVEAKILKRLDKLDGKLNEYLKSNIVHYIIMPVNFRVNHQYQAKQNETPLEQTRRILNKSDALYKGILESVETTLRILDKILKNNQEGEE